MIGAIIIASIPVLATERSTADGANGTSVTTPSTKGVCGCGDAENATTLIATEDLNNCRPGV